MFKSFFLIQLAVFVLAGCARSELAPIEEISEISFFENENLMPVVNSNVTETNNLLEEKSEQGKTHTVRDGETFVSIAKDYGLSDEELGDANYMTAPYSVSPGQILKIPSVDTIKTTDNTFKSDQKNDSFNSDTELKKTKPVLEKPVVSPKLEDKKVIKDTEIVKDTEKVVLVPKGKMLFPVNGETISEFGQNDGIAANEGINIKAPYGSDVFCSLSGDVSFVGDVDGYGKTVIIKHNSKLATTYSHLDNAIVSVGDKVVKGNVIGKVGNSGGVDDPQLHFAVIESGKAVDPYIYLEK